MNGWIKIHRQIVDWEWYDDPNTFRVFMHLLLTANHKDKKYRGMTLKAGTILTGRDKLAEETGLSVRQCRTALERLKSTSEVTIETSSKGTVIQVVKYKDYQLSTSKTTNERPTSDQQTTTNKKDKKEKKYLRAYRSFDHLSISQDEFSKLISDGWDANQIDDILDRIENYKQNKKYKSLYLTCKNWLKREYGEPGEQKKQTTDEKLSANIMKQIEQDELRKQTRDK